MSFAYPVMFEELATGDLDFTQANVRVLLLTDKHQPDLEHSDRGDVQADEVTGLGYTAGGNDVDCFVERDDEKTDVQLCWQRLGTARDHRRKIRLLLSPPRHGSRDGR